MADPTPTPDPTPPTAPVPPPAPDIDADIAALVVALIGPALDTVGARFKGVDAGLAAITARLDAIDAKFAGSDTGGTGPVDPPPPPPPSDPLGVDVSIPSGSTPTAGQPILFSALITGGAPGPMASYAWDFGDGSTSGDISPIHTYTTAGPVTVKVAVVDGAGITAWATLAIAVAGAAQPPPPPPPPEPAPLTLTLAIPGRPPLVFAEAGAADLGDFAGPGFVQRCRRATAGPWTVDFRPDRGSDRVEVVVELGRLWGAANAAGADVLPPAGATAAYTATIARGDAAVATVAVPAHNFFSRWRYQSAPRPALRTHEEVRALAGLPPFDPEFLKIAAPSGPVAYAGPMDGAGIYKVMGTAGDRPDIGPVTEWAADWLATGRPAALASMLAQAEASGSVPWHFRDENTGAPLSVRDHPKVSIADRNPGPPTEFVARPKNAWAIDDAHHPCLAFVPYLATGDPYYLEELQAAATYIVCWDHRNRDIPRYDKAVISTFQTRSFAWGVRAVAHAAVATPADAPAWLLPAAYWRGVLADCLDHFTRTFVADPAPQSAVFRAATRHDFVSVFMEDYLSFALAWAVRLGLVDWAAARDWKAGAQLARCGAGGSGWPAEFCCPYEYDPNVAPTWAGMLAAWPAATVALHFDPGLAGGAAGLRPGVLYQKWWGYAYYLMGGLALLGTPDARAAYAAVKAMSLKGPAGDGRQPAPAPYRWAFAPDPAPPA